MVEINQREKQDFKGKLDKYNVSKKNWIDEQMKEYRKKRMPILIFFILLLLAMVIIPIVVPCFPDKYSWIGVLLIALLSICNKISAMKNTRISQGIDYCYKSKRDSLRTEFDKKYYKLFPKPSLSLTSLEELREQYQNER